MTIRLRGIAKLSLPIGFALLLGASAARAQAVSRDSMPIAADTAWRGWGYLAIGPGSQNGDSRLAGALGLWFTHGRLALGGRLATVSRVLEPGDASDVSLLVGVHPLTERHLDIVAGAGLGMSGGTGSGGERLTNQPALAVGAQLNGSYAFIGLGLNGFATITGGRGYYGVGLAVVLGAFR